MPSTDLTEEIPFSSTEDSEGSHVKHYSSRIHWNRLNRRVDNYRSRTLPWSMKLIWRFFCFFWSKSIGSSGNVYVSVQSPTLVYSIEKLGSDYTGNGYSFIPATKQMTKWISSISDCVCECFIYAGPINKNFLASTLRVDHEISHPFPTAREIYLFILHKECCNMNNRKLTGNPRLEKRVRSQTADI